MPIPNYEGIAWDDIWRFNPQACSQWDGFRHFSTDMGDGTRAWYGNTTSDEITSGESARIGIGHWAQEGIAARGFLIDYVSYAEKKGKSLSHITFWSTFAYHTLLGLRYRGKWDEWPSNYTRGSVGDRQGV